jgi:hypothetical protein
MKAFSDYLNFTAIFVILSNGQSKASFCLFFAIKNNPRRLDLELLNGFFDVYWRLAISQISSKNGPTPL